MFILQQIGAVLSVILGLLAVFFPRTIEKLVSIQAVGKLGVSEIRATYGGFFLGISIFALYSQDKNAFIALGLGWLSAALVRLGTFIFGNATRENAGGIIFEAVIGLLCLSSLNT